MNYEERVKMAEEYQMPSHVVPHLGLLTALDDVIEKELNMMSEEARSFDPQTDSERFYATVFSPYSLACCLGSKTFNISLSEVMANEYHMLKGMGDPIVKDMDVLTYVDTKRDEYIEKIQPEANEFMTKVMQSLDKEVTANQLLTLLAHALSSVASSHHQGWHTYMTAQAFGTKEITPVQE